MNWARKRQRLYPGRQQTLPLQIIPVGRDWELELELMRSLSPFEYSECLPKPRCTLALQPRSLICAHFLEQFGVIEHEYGVYIGCT